MTPTAISTPLNRLRQRERLIALAWGFCRWLAVVVAGLTIACVIDWWVDRRHDTPRELRIGLVVAQLAIAAIAAGALLVMPLIRRRPDDDLALYAEEKRPDLNHRLISAVQLTRPNAAVTGMSPDLIAAVVREAIAKVQAIHFPALADHRRLPWAGYVLGAILAFAAVTFAVEPHTARALIARQFLADVEIPRRNLVSNATAAVQPAAEPVTIELLVQGAGPYNGELRISTQGGRTERLPLDSDPDQGVLKATLPSPGDDFSFEAWVGDGRLKRPGHVRLVPRPAVVEVNATLILPKGIGVRPDGSRFEQSLPRGEVIGIRGCSARIVIRTQKPIVRAELELLSSADPVSGAPPSVIRTIGMTLDGETGAAATFELRDREASYRITVWDEFNFRNLDPPRREVRLVPEEPPIVALLAEQFRPDGVVTASAEEFEVDGVPVPLGAGIRIGYTVSHPYGLGKAVLVYRINENEWHRLLLSETPSTTETGPFDPRRGCFVRSRLSDQVQWHAAPSPDPQRIPERLEGGGRFDFQTRALPGLKVGDQIEYFLEVTNRDPEHPLVGRSEARVKKVVTVAELVEWIDGALRQEDRIRRLAERQRGIFDPRARPESPNP